MAENLIYYFVYMAVSNTLLPLPTPPAVLAAGVLIGPFLAALIGGAANCVGASVDYWVGTKIPKSDSERYHQIAPFLIKFKKNAFLAIVIAGFTPFIFDPIRLAAGHVKYDFKRYLMAVFLGRFPRFYLLAYIGRDVWKVLWEAFI